MSEKVVIIGSGPAGHTAAIYTGRANLSPLMFEGANPLNPGDMMPGGQLTTTTEVENFPGFPEGVDGFTLTQNFRAQSERCGTKIVTENVEKIDLSSYPFKIQSTTQSVEAETVIISTGAIAKRMSVPGEDSFWTKGISACAVCDGALPLFREKVLVVVGGGDSACEEASYLTKYGSKVIMLVRRDEMRASKVMQDRVQNNPKIEIMWKTQLVSAHGDELLGSVKVDQDGTEKEVPCSGLFYAIGHTPNTAFLEGQILTDDTGYIITKPDSMATNVDGVFACGDVQDKVWRQAITAAGTGCMAALEAERWLEAKHG